MALPVRSYRKSDTDPMPGEQRGCGGDEDSQDNTIDVCKGYELEENITLSNDWMPIMGCVYGCF